MLNPEAMADGAQVDNGNYRYYSVLCFAHIVNELQRIADALEELGEEVTKP